MTAAAGSRLTAKGQASRTTMLLQISVVFLVIGLFCMLADISSRYANLQNGFRENAVWSMFQLDRESRKFMASLHRLVEDEDRSQARLRDVSIRYDIVYSRINTVESGRFDINFDADSDIASSVKAIKALILRNEPLLSRLSKGEDVPEADLRHAMQDLSGLLSLTEELLVYTNNAASAYRADRRTELATLQLRSAIIIGLLVICVGCLVFSLRRQLKSMREASENLEAMADRLNAAYLDAEAGNRAKSQFMATIGHEVRTPLNAILGTAELLQLGSPPPSIAAGISTIRRSGEALLEIINEVLDFAKIEHGNLVTEPRPVDIREVVANTIEIIRDRAVENGNDVRLELDRDLASDLIVTDPTRLRQVLLNLMSNAAKFTREGVITLRVRDAGGPSASVIRFEVVDTGIGIDPAGVKRLFQPFSQVDASISRRFGGTGLGLAICKQIVETIGGRIGVESELGKGSTFWFEIPRIACCALGSLPVAKQDAEEGILRKLEILLVEDNKINQQVASGLLRYLGHSVALAEDGLQAVALVAQQRFDLILMDMQMPVLDGIEATRRIRALGGWAADVPVIAMTANASDHDRTLCIEAGMNGFQSKPISLQQLRDLIRSAVDDRPERATPAIESGEFEERSAELVAVLGHHDFLDLLQHFFTDADILVADLAKAVEGGEDDRVDRILHALKGAAASVCLQGLADKVEDLRELSLSDRELTQLKDELAARRQRLAA